MNKRDPRTPGTRQQCVSRWYYSLDGHGICPCFHIHPSCSSSQSGGGVPLMAEPPRTECSSSFVHTHFSFLERRGVFFGGGGTISVVCREEITEVQNAEWTFISWLMPETCKGQESALASARLSRWDLNQSREC